jgi:hypothetical protein
MHSAQERSQLVLRSHSRCNLLNQVLEPVQAEFRNFNVCPHCEKNRDEALLTRISEGMPMISRSDGYNFHLLLADRPLPYPMEKTYGVTRITSLCFWYMYGAEGAQTKSTVVLIEDSARSKQKVFRQIEFVADILADELVRRRELAVLYNLQGSSIVEQSY